MEVKTTAIEGVLIIEPTVFGDERGYFFESFNEREFREKTGIDVKFVQDNESKSRYGVLRGLHFQKAPFEQAKLVRVVKGRVFELTGDNHRQCFIPRGFAHGFCVLSEEAVFQYKCDEYYHPEAEDAIAWDDPDIAIQWPIPASDIILSDKDKNHPRLRDSKI